VPLPTPAEGPEVRGREETCLKRGPRGRQLGGAKTKGGGQTSPMRGRGQTVNTKNSGSVGGIRLIENVI